MTGRDPNEPHRAATPLELLYDLTLVVAFSLAGSQFAHALTEDHVVEGMLGFGVAMFAITLAWINFSWFASAYDTDDAFMRLATLVQMVGVLVMALGLHDVFEGFAPRRVRQRGPRRGLRHDARLDGRALVARRAARPAATLDLPGVRPRHRRRPGRLDHHRARPAADRRADRARRSLLFAVEVGGTIWIETHFPSTPWHPHHIAERYSLLAIITFGEVILGTTTAIEAVVAEQGWSAEAAVIALAGVSLAVGLWWCYFTVPYGEALRGSNARSMVFGFGHMLLYAAIAATGAGLHAAAYLLEHHSELDTAQTLLTMAIPVGLFVVVLFVLFHVMFPGRDPLHYWLLAGTLVVLVAAWLLAVGGASMTVALAVLMLAPWVTVAGYELRGHRHLAEVVGRA